MTEHVTNEIDQNSPLGYKIKETVTTTGYVDDDGKFIPVDEIQQTEAVTYVQDEEDAVQV